jgi:hypothetical protein
MLLDFKAVRVSLEQKLCHINHSRETMEFIIDSQRRVERDARSSTSSCSEFLARDIPIHPSSVGGADCPAIVDIPFAYLTFDVPPVEDPILDSMWCPMGE